MIAVVDCCLLLFVVYCGCALTAVGGCLLCAVCLGLAVVIVGRCCLPLLVACLLLD